ncbi:hypothetical protein YPPY29_2715, partial [Yersinia pestis PY-29]|jgi:hypothetical protein
MGQ